LKSIQILFIFCLFFSSNIIGQNNPEMDSLSKVLHTSINQTEKAKIHNRLAWLYLTKDIAIAKSHLDSSMVLYSALKNERGKAFCNYKYGVLYRLTGKYDSAINYLNKHLSYVKSKNDSLNIANVTYQKGVVYSLQGNYKKSLNEYYKILNIYQKLKDSVSIGFTLNSIGIVYKNLNKYPQAIQSFDKAVSIHKAQNDLPNLANVYNSLGSVYAEQKQYDKAIDCFYKTLEIDKRLHNNLGIAINYKDIGTLLLEKKQYKKALLYFTKSYKIITSNGFDAEKAAILGKIGATYTALKKYGKAKEFLTKSFTAKIPSKRVYKDLHYHLYNLYYQTNNYKKALEHYKEYTNYKDSLLNKTNLKNINRLQIQFETQKKDNEIIKQQLQLEQKNQEIQKKKNQTYLLMGLAGFFLISTIFLWSIFKQRQKRKNQEIAMLKREHKIKSLELLIEGEENERLRIAKELHDGVNGDLSAIKYKLTSMQNENNKTIDEAVKMIDNSCKQVRAISHNLVPPSLKNFNVVEATEIFCQNMNALHKPHITFQHIGGIPKINKKAKINIFRIIQELITNGIKHANATEIDVQLSCRDHHIQITVEDNGKGFDTSNKKNNGIGLQNIQSRIEYLQANIDVISNNKGTSYTIEINLNKLNDH